MRAPRGGDRGRTHARTRAAGCAPSLRTACFSRRATTRASWGGASAAAAAAAPPSCASTAARPRSRRWTSTRAESALCRALRGGSSCSRCPPQHTHAHIHTHTHTRARTYMYVTPRARRPTGQVPCVRVRHVDGDRLAPAHARARHPHRRRVRLRGLPAFRRPSFPPQRATDVGALRSWELVLAARDDCQCVWRRHAMVCARQRNAACGWRSRSQTHGVRPATSPVLCHAAADCGWGRIRGSAAFRVC